MKKKFISISSILLIILAIIGLIGIKKVNSDRGEHSEEPKHSHKKGHGGEHGEDGEHGEEGVAKLSPKQMKEFGVELDRVKRGYLYQELELTGEVIINPDLLAHIVPRVSGIVKTVHARLGDRVRKGQLLAVLESRELAQLKADYLSALEWAKLARESFKRYRELRKDRVISELQFLKSKENLARAEIRLRSAKQKLLALGFTERFIARLQKNKDRTPLTVYYIRSPLTGIIIQKHITVGERVSPEHRVFTIANLSKVWIDLKVYQKDIPKLRIGQTVRVFALNGSIKGEGKVFYISPVLNESLRTVSIRVELDNHRLLWKPGLFVRGELAIEKIPVKAMVKKEAIQELNGKKVVFVKEGEGFVPRRVVIGRRDSSNVEIIDGLKEGEIYVANGSFIIKSQFMKESFGEGHAH